MYVEQSLCAPQARLVSILLAPAARDGRKYTHACMTLGTLSGWRRVKHKQIGQNKTMKTRVSRLSIVAISFRSSCASPQVALIQWTLLISQSLLTVTSAVRIFDGNKRYVDRSVFCTGSPICMILPLPWESVCKRQLGFTEHPECFPPHPMQSVTAETAYATFFQLS